MLKKWLSFSNINQVRHKKRIHIESQQVLSPVLRGPTASGPRSVSARVPVQRAPLAHGPRSHPPVVRPRGQADTVTTFNRYLPWTSLDISKWTLNALSILPTCALNPCLLYKWIHKYQGSKQEILCRLKRWNLPFSHYWDSFDLEITPSAQSIPLVS